jgi:hypothetical protein
MNQDDVAPVEKTDDVGNLPFSVFRFAEAKRLEEAGVMTSEFDVTSEVQALIVAAMQAGLGEGQETRVLFQAPGFSLIHAWFKPAFPLPRHSHNVDCLYYIAAGSLWLGDQELGIGDGFFVPADVPYTYLPGSQGVEVLEIRQKTHFSLVGHANTVRYWKKAIATIEGNRESWRTTERPSTAA